MRICIWGESKSYYEEAIRTESESLGHQAKILNLEELYININSQQLLISHRKYDLLKEFDVFLFWYIPESINKYVNIIALYLFQNQKRVIENSLIDESFNIVKDYVKLIENKIKVLEFFYLFNVKAARDILIDLEHPIAINILNDKESVSRSNDWTDTYDMVRVAKFKEVSFFKLMPQKEFYRVLYIGGEVIGVIECRADTAKCEDVFFRSRYLHKASLENDKIPKGLIEFVIKISQILNIQMALFDIAMDDKSEYVVLDIRRSFKFKSFAKISGVNVARKIAEFMIR